MKVDRVYRYGCTRAPTNEALALQLLGQASNYREDLRRIYNDATRALRELAREKDDSAHVASFVYEEKRRRIREARGRRGSLLDAGTYWLVDAAIKQAAKTSGLDPIRAERWEATGRIGAAIQSVDQFPADAWTHKRVSLTQPNERRVADLTILVGPLAEARSITWSVKLHRPLPEGAIVKQVAVQRIRYGHRFRWEALVTVSFEDRREARDPDARGVVGIDVGWRSEGDDVRVATSDGDRGVEALLIDTLEAFDYANAVRSIRDLTFDAAKDYVHREGLPGAEHANLWRDKDRMRRLARRTGALGPVWWVERDKHLEDIEQGVRRRAILRRLDAYRVFADGLAKRYRTVALEDMPMLDWVGEADAARIERQRSAAAIYLLQQAIAHRFGPERVDWMPAAGTSTRCSECGVDRGQPVGPTVHWTCASCGVVHHQDENAARNIRLDCERWIDEGKPVRARTRKSSKRKEVRRGDGIATGTERGMVVTAREPSSEAAE